MVKANPYVYPYIPFKNLSKKEIKDNFLDKKKITLENLKKIVSEIKIPSVKIEGNNLSEKILSIFQDENIRFGPREYIEKNKNFWIEKINYFVNKKLPLQFTILGFPFKIPVPLKTNRKLPDMGEVLALLRLKHITDLIKKIYQPGAEIVVFTEGAFGKFVGVCEREWKNYKNFLEKLKNWLGFSSIKLKDLIEIEKEPNFLKFFKKRIREFKKLFREKDPEFLQKYYAVWDSIFRIVSSRKYPEQILMDVYNERLNDNEVSKKVKKIREILRKKTHEAIFQYFAYLKVRDDLHYLEKVSPKALPLTVSPKPNRLGILPIHKKNEKLPYHGVPVFYPKKKIFLIEYLIDIKTSPLNYTLVYFNLDKEKKPFYYIAQETKNTS